MKKFLTIIICLLILVGCSKETRNTNPNNIKISEEALSFSDKYEINYDNLDLDVSIIDSNGSSITLYLLREVTDETATDDLIKICDFIKTFVNKNRLFDYYSQNDWDSSSLKNNNKTVLLSVRIKKQDFKITINRMNGLSYKGSEQTYSIYKINFLEQ
jgi:hypothetical protein